MPPIVIQKVDVGLIRLKRGIFRYTVSFFDPSLRQYDLSFQGASRDAFRAAISDSGWSDKLDEASE